MIQTQAQFGAVAVGIGGGSTELPLRGPSRGSIYLSRRPSREVNFTSRSRPTCMYLFQNHAHHFLKSHTTFSKSCIPLFQNPAYNFSKSRIPLFKITHYPFSKSCPTLSKIMPGLIQNHTSPISKSRITLFKISHHFHIMFQFLVKIATHFFESQFKYHDFYFVVQ